MGELVGVEPKFERTTNTIGGIPTENSKRRALVGATTVGWKDGMRRMVEAQVARSGSGAASGS